MADRPPKWPLWWELDIALIHHVRMRMIDRGSTDLDPFGMLERARGLHPAVPPGR